MSSQRFTLLALATALFTLVGCGRPEHSFNLEHREVEFLSEDVLDLNTVLFQAAENAYLGDPIEIEDILGYGNARDGYEVTYDLVHSVRTGLGRGSGRAALRIEEDGVPLEEPLSFQWDTTLAEHVQLIYELRYLGETFFGRETDIDLVVVLEATRTDLGDFLIEYRVDGDCFLGNTFCDVSTHFFAYGGPRDGIERRAGGGTGTIDDPDVFAPLRLEFRYEEDDFFRVEGGVGVGAYFNEIFYYAEVL